MKILLVRKAEQKRFREVALVYLHRYNSFV